MAPNPSLCAMVQYMFDMRHTALGTKLLSRAGPLLPEELKGKVACITGGTGGIGLAAAQALCAAGAEVHILGRSAERGAAASRAPTAESPGSIVFHQLDLSSVDAARALDKLMGETLGQRRLDILVQNLAIMNDAEERVGDHEKTVATNLISFYSVGSLLHKRMAEGGRSISVVSAGMHLYKMDPGALAALDAGAEGSAVTGKNFDPIYAYSVTHRARVLLTQRWAAENPAIRLSSVHPGWVQTEGLQNAQAMQAFYRLMRFSLRSAEQGADTIAWLAAPSSKYQSGGYFWDRSERRVDMPLSGTAANEADVNALVKWLEAATE